VTEPDIAEVCRLAGMVLDQVEQAVVGKRRSLSLILSSVLSRGHVLLEARQLPGEPRPLRLEVQQAGKLRSASGGLRAGAVRCQHQREQTRQRD